MLLLYSYLIIILPIHKIHFDSITIHSPWHRKCDNFHVQSDWSLFLLSISILNLILKRQTDNATDITALPTLAMYRCLSGQQWYQVVVVDGQTVLQSTETGGRYTAHTSQSQQQPQQQQ